MAANGTSSIKLEKSMNGVAALLTYAACEWFLIFLLLVDALLSYLAVQFARYCDLQVPCFLCSRLDHVFSKEKSDFYRTLMCNNHRSEISSLLSCQTHGNLADGFGMCDDCLLSSTKKNKSNPELHRVLLGKAGFDLLMKPNFTNTPPNARLCSCCNKPWRSRHNAHKLLQQRLPGNCVGKPPMPRRMGRRGSLKNMRDKLVVKSKNAEKHRNGDSISHVGYTGIKITSDSESEFLFSDDGGLGHLENESKVEFSDLSALETPSQSFSEDEVSMKIALYSSDAEKPCTDPCEKLDLNDKHDEKHLVEDEKTSQAPLPELIQLDEIPQPKSQNANTTVLSQLISPVDACLPLNALEAPDRELSEKSTDTKASERETASGDKHNEILKLYIAAASDGIGERVVNGPSKDPSYVAQSEAHNIPANAKERELTGSVARQPLREKHGIVNEDLKVSQSQNITGERTDLSLNHTDHNIEYHGDEEPSQVVTEASSSKGFLNHKHSASLKSFNGSTVSDIEGENLVDWLRRQVEYDKKCVSALHKELEEERNASEIAANHAMAMITRLQEEKAALHMEALQYLRMMEEQAEHDMDALERANDMLAEKEKEMQDLEAELEYYRLKFSDESLDETITKDSCDLSNTSVITLKYDDAKVPGKLGIPMDTNDSDKTSDMQPSWPGIEDEKVYISECLRSMERKLDEVYDDQNSECAENGAHRVGLDDDGSMMKQKMEENVKVQGDSVGNWHLFCSEQSDPTIGKENKLVFLENEISGLKDRLETLNADRCFLERSINMLDNGKEGLEFVQKIASQLQELRNIGIRRTCQSAS